jgi:hypothetical protein
MTLILSGTDGLSDVDGSAATPAIRGTDANTGIFFPAADTIAFSEGGVEAARFDSAGNFGLGVTPSAWFSGTKAVQLLGASFTSTASTGYLYQNSYLDTNTFEKYYANGFASKATLSSGGHQWFTAASGTAGNTISFTQAMTLDASGNLGIGTTSPSDTVGYGRALDIQSTIGAAVYMRDSTNPTTQYGAIAFDGNADVNNLNIINASSTGPIRLFTNGNERARITSAGDLLVGRTSTIGSSRLLTKGTTTDSTASAFGAYASSDGELFLIRNDGAVFTGGASLSPYNNTTATAANVVVNSNGSLARSTSSLKYKKDVQDSIHGLVDLLKLRSVTYKQKNTDIEGNAVDAVFGGLIAEEVHAAGLAEFVQYADDGSPDALSYGNMVSLCIKAIQEQQAIITTLTDRITALEAK